MEKEFTLEELNLFRQWYNAVEDTAIGILKLISDLIEDEGA